MPENFGEFFSGLGSRIDTNKTAGMNATYQFIASGEGGGEYFVKFNNGIPEVGNGRADNPTIALTASAPDWVAIMNRQMNGQTAFLTGKLKIQGDVTLAMKLESIFNLG